MDIMFSSAKEPRDTVLMRSEYNCTLLGCFIFRLPGLFRSHWFLKWLSVYFLLILSCSLSSPGRENVGRNKRTVIHFGKGQWTLIPGSPEFKSLISFPLLLISFYLEKVTWYSSLTLSFLGDNGNK